MNVTHLSEGVDDVIEFKMSFRIVLNLGVIERMKRDCLEKPDISENGSDLTRIYTVYYIYYTVQLQCQICYSIENKIQLLFVDLPLPHLPGTLII